MHAQLAVAVELELGDVVGDVVDLGGAVGGGVAEDAPNDLSHLVRHHVPIGPSEVGRHGHGGEVGDDWGAQASWRSGRTIP